MGALHLLYYFSYICQVCNISIVLVTIILDKQIPTYHPTENVVEDYESSANSQLQTYFDRDKDVELDTLLYLRYYELYIKDATTGKVCFV